MANRLGLTAKQLIAVKNAVKMNDSGKYQEAEAGEWLDQRSHNGRTALLESDLSFGDEIVRALHLVRNLDERESTIIRMRFGLEGMETRSLKEIAVQFGLTPERVRQIEKDVLRKLKGYMQST